MISYQHANTIQYRPVRSFKMGGFELENFANKCINKTHARPSNCTSSCSAFWYARVCSVPVYCISWQVYSTAAKLKVTLLQRTPPSWCSGGGGVRSNPPTPPCVRACNRSGKDNTNYWQKTSQKLTFEVTSDDRITVTRHTGAMHNTPSHSQLQFLHHLLVLYLV